MKKFHVHVHVDDLAKSVTDPQGIAWEHFHTLGNIPVFNEVSQSTNVGACRAPATAAKADAACCAPISVAKTITACCAPAEATAAQCLRAPIPNRPTLLT